MLQNLLYFDQKKTHECLGLPMSSKKVKVSRNEKRLWPNSPASLTDP